MEEIAKNNDVQKRASKKWRSSNGVRNRTVVTSESSLPNERFEKIKSKLEAKGTSFSKFVIEKLIEFDEATK